MSWKLLLLNHFRSPQNHWLAFKSLSGGFQSLCYCQISLCHLECLWKSLLISSKWLGISFKSLGISLKSLEISSKSLSNHFENGFQRALNPFELQIWTEEGSFYSVTGTVALVSSIGWRPPDRSRVLKPHSKLNFRIWRYNFQNTKNIL